MKQIKILSMLVVLLAMGCKKYEEGPSMSFRSAKSRVEGKWNVTSYTIKNQEQIKSWLYENARIVYCNSTGKIIPIDGPGIERRSLTEVKFEFSSGGDVTRTSSLRYESIDLDATETQCKAIWKHENTAVGNTKNTWELDKNKENIIFKDGSTLTNYQIIMLKEKQMKVKTSNSSGEIIYTMEKI